jgi:small subunit ribosomal protein S3Ae
MAKARSRTAARKIKDRWKAKNWYSVLAPPSFENVNIAEALSDSPEGLINRVTGVSLQDLTNDFRRSHITLYFRINKVEESNAHTQFVGHALTSDYLRRMIRRRKSKIDGVYDVTTRDGAFLRVKPFATTEKRIQNSQKTVIRQTMKKTIEDQAKVSTMSEFVTDILDGKIGSEIYKNCKKLYPVKRIEIYKTEVISQPTIMIEDKKPKKKEKEEAEKVEEKKEKKTEEIKEPKTKEELKEEKPKKVKAEKKKAKPKTEPVKEKPEKEAVKKAVKKISKKVAKPKAEPKKKKTVKKATKKAK